MATPRRSKGELDMMTFKYDVDLHFTDAGWDTYEVKANCIDNARYAAIQRVINEINREYANKIDCIRVYRHENGEFLKEYTI